MPSAHAQDDAEVAFTVSSFEEQTRITQTFQVFERLSASFRYSMLYEIRSAPDPASPVYPYIFDRSFSLHYNILDEGRYRPALSFGINDILGTGVYGGEYLVATKTFAPHLRGTVGLGWGRLGSYGGFSNPLAKIFGDGFLTRPSTYDAEGGAFHPDALLHGDAAFFGGIEWQANDKFRFVAEYSSDDYARERNAELNPKSPFNFGLTYQHNDRTSVSANYLYGSEFGIQLTYVINPKKPRFGSGLDTAPPPILSPAKTGGLLDLSRTDHSGRLRDALAQEGVSLEGLVISGRVLRVQIRNDRYSIASQAVGRTARVLARLAPSEVETFDIRLSVEGMPVTAVILRRVDLEDLEFHPVAPDLLRSRTMVLDVPESLPIVDGRFPILTYGLAPYLTPSLFDPDNPLRADAGIALRGRYEPAPGLVFSGVVRQKVIGNLDEATRQSDSVLPHVRSDASLYFKEGSTALSEATAAYYFRPGEDLFGRVTAGYLETMFGGVSAEVLWKPQNSRLALGAELNYVIQRDFDQKFGFQDYKVTTGHVSAYYELGSGFQAQLDLGRYLAGDVGSTVSFAREFDNGWRIGAFATFTNVSSADFGEGAFDKGITITIPIDWVTGRPSQTKYDTVIQPVQRDGGARLAVSGRLYDLVRGSQATELDSTWGRFWR